MSERDFHPLVKQLLDGEVTIADLPAELRAEGEEALRLLTGIDRSPVELPAVTRRVMQTLASRPAPAVPAWKRVMRPREIRLRIRPWVQAHLSGVRRGQYRSDLDERRRTPER